MTAPAVYISIPIELHVAAARLETLLRDAGLVPLNPCRITPTDIPKEDLPAFVADACYRMIESCRVVVLWADRYGRDCATECGYSFALGRPVVAFAPTPERSPIQQDWMLRPRLHAVATDEASLLQQVHAAVGLVERASGQTHDQAGSM